MTTQNFQYLINYIYNYFNVSGFTDSLLLFAIFCVTLRYSTRLFHFLNANNSKNSGFISLLCVFISITYQILLSFALDIPDASRLGFIAWLIYLSAILVLMLILISLTTDLNPFIEEEDSSIDLQRLENGEYDSINYLIAGIWMYLAVYSGYCIYLFSNACLISNPFLHNNSWTVVLQKSNSNDIFSSLVNSMLSHYTGLSQSLLLQACAMLLIIYSLFGTYEVLRKKN